MKLVAPLTVACLTVAALGLSLANTFLEQAEQYAIAKGLELLVDSATSKGKITNAAATGAAKAAEAHSSLGTALRRQDKLAEATASFQRAIEIKPDYIGAHYNRAGLHEFVPGDQHTYARLPNH